MALFYDNHPEMSKTAHGLRAAAMRNPEGRLPRELERIIADFAYYDWRNLLKVFPETTESSGFRLYAMMCNGPDGMAEMERTLRKSTSEGQTRYPIRVDVDGNIIEINLGGQQLTDEAIGDLSKLPSTLKTLNLARCNLTSFNVAALPQGLMRST